MKKNSVVSSLLALGMVAAIGTGATLAFLSDSTDKLVNTFTLADGIQMKLHEDRVDASTHKIIGENDVIAGEDAGNTYLNVLPGEVLPKDPTVLIEKNSVDCYVFVGVKNPSSNYLELRITEAWKKIDQVDDVTYYVYAIDGKTPTVVNTSEDDQNLTPVFETVKVGNVDIKEEGKKVSLQDVVIKASAVQSKIAGVDSYEDVAEEGLALVKRGFGM